MLLAEFDREANAVINPDMVNVPGFQSWTENN